MTTAPIGYYCDHSDEPMGERTHHEWDLVEDQGWVFQHKPETISAHSGLQEYLTPEQQKQRCPRATAVYTVDAVEQARRIAVELEQSEARLRDLLETLTKEWGKEQDAELAYSDSYTGTENASLAYQRGATLERCGDDIRHLLEHGEMPDWFDADAATFDEGRAAS